MIARSELAPKPVAPAPKIDRPVFHPMPEPPTFRTTPAALRPQPHAFRSEPEPPTFRTEPPALRPELAKAAPAKPEPAKPEPVKTPAAAQPSASQTTRPSASQTTVVLNGASTVTHAEGADLGRPVDLLARAGLSPNGHKPAPVVAPTIAPARPPRAARPPFDLERELKALVPQGNDLDAANIVAARATLLIGRRDKRATDATLDAARRLLTHGKLQSASDLLLDYIAHGLTDREPQRLLIEIDCAIGRRDTAKEKCHLLSHAYRLDGRTDVAEDVERIARIL
jgi:hypothetical protein